MFCRDMLFFASNLLTYFNYSIFFLQILLGGFYPSLGIGMMVDPLLLRRVSALCAPFVTNDLLSNEVRFKVFIALQFHCTQE